MHTISISESNGEYRFECSCGVVGNWYGTRELAQSTGNSHKRSYDNPQDRGSKDDPWVGY